jgi:hypothetical protein
MKTTLHRKSDSGLCAGLLVILLSVIGLQAQTNQIDGSNCQIKFCAKPVQLLALAPRAMPSSKSFADVGSASAPPPPYSNVDRKLVKPLPRVQWGPGVSRDLVTGKSQGIVLLSVRF